MKSFALLNHIILLAAGLLLAACGGGSSTTNVGQNNLAPTANAGAAQSVDELSVVTLDGSASADADNDPLTFAWSQTAGMAVTLSSTTTAQATFDAPDVTAANTTEVLTFQLTVNDGTTSANATVNITVNDVGLGTNTPPTADAGPDQTVVELTQVTLDASASTDPDGSTLTYSWAQTAGAMVALAAGTTASPTFDAPDVTGSDTLTFEVTVNDGSLTATDMVDVVVQETLSAVTVAGTVSYEFVNPAANCRGLDFANIDVRPIRAATVQLLDASNTVLGESVLGDDGSYSFSNSAPNTDIRIRVRAELKRSGAPEWDVEVRDNVDTSANPPPLAQRPLYVTQWPLFNSGTNNSTNNDFTATTGWGGSSYTGTRAAAPFAILDAIYDGMLLVLTADASASFGPLDAFWSVNNTSTGTTDNIDAGELPTSFYIGNPSSLFLLGDANTDTEEFDDHVTIHEWGHYFEDNFSRSDNIGGAHAIGETIDARVAFGEGWATALSAMALDEPVYCDTQVPGTNGGFGINVESNNSGPQGYYNEMSVATLVYDLWDTNDEAGDPGSIGFGPIFDVMTTEQRLTEVFTTLFSFGTELRANVTGADLTIVESLLSRENIDLTGLDIFGSNQTGVPAGSRDVLPVYTNLPVDGSVTSICLNSDFDSGRDGNKLSEHRYFRFTTTSSSAYNVSITANPVPPPTNDPAPTPPDVINDRSDPDMYIWRDGALVASGSSGDADSETFLTQVLPADTYVVDLQEWRYSDEDASSDFPEQICFDVTMSP